MTALPTCLAENGRRGVWYVDVHAFAMHIPVLHALLIGPGGAPWPNQFLKGDRYDQPCNSRSPEKAGQAKRLRQLGMVVLTNDFWSDPPGIDRPDTIRIRIQHGGYVGLFVCHAALFRGGHLTFRRGAQLCHLLRPGELR
jgi:hypothetical protein